MKYKATGLRIDAIVSDKISHRIASTAPSIETLENSDLVWDRKVSEKWAKRIADCLNSCEKTNPRIL